MLVEECAYLRTGRDLDAFFRKFGYTIDPESDLRYAYHTDMVQHYPGAVKGGLRAMAPNNSLTEAPETRMRSFIIFSTVTVSLVGALAWSLPAASQDKQAGPDSSIRKLLFQRRDVLRELLDFVTAHHELGTVTLADVVQARNGWLEAELDVARTREERVQIHERRVKNWRDLESLTRQDFAAGTATPKEMLVAKAARLKAEIELLREKTAND